MNNARRNLIMGTPLIASLFWIMISAGSAGAQDSASFDRGLEGWTPVGPVSLDHDQAYQGSACLKITGAGRVTRRFSTSPLKIVEYHVFIKTSGAAVQGTASLRFYNAADQLILQYQAQPVSDTGYRQTGDYTEAPPGTRYMTVDIAQSQGPAGAVYVDEIHVNPDVEGDADAPPQCNLDQYMRPFWDTDTVFNETILLYAVGGAAATGKLLYQPAEILSVQSYDLHTVYSPGIDYTFRGQVLTRTPDSRMPFKADTFFTHKGDLAWYQIQSQWVVVTYTHKDPWPGPIPVYQGGKMPQVMRKLTTRSPLTVVAYGMSITRGMDVSGYDRVPPFMPTYAALFVDRLRRRFDDSITLYNAGLPGATVDWGARYADQYVNPLHPDLVIVDFGMNDFWTKPPEAFRDDVQTIIDKVRSVHPQVEFLLLSNMAFDPDYILDTNKDKPVYLSRIEGYRQVLREMETTGIITLDMTTLSSILYRRKKAKDCVANPLHPNDYLARWYAQGMTALLNKAAE